MSKRIWLWSVLSLALAGVFSTLLGETVTTEGGKTVEPGKIAEKGVYLVLDGKPQAVIVVAEDAPDLTHQAASLLADYIRRISGAELPIVKHPEDAGAAAILWVGAHPALFERYPELDLAVNQPEETLIRTTDRDIIILGRDIVKLGTQLEAGTNLAVNSFLEDQLGVRWFWPGELGTDIPQSSTILIEPVEIRYTPQLKLRYINLLNTQRGVAGLKTNGKAYQSLASYVEDPEKWGVMMDQLSRDWLNRHRGDARIPNAPHILPLAGSWSNLRRRHEFGAWYELYSKEHPDWFAMQPDGSRQEGKKNPYPRASDVKMCISNPGIAEQWLKNAKEIFENDPFAFSMSASEGDLGWQGYCLCEACLAWDNPNAEILENPLRWEHESRPFYALTDRYAKFWNVVAPALKEAFPDREAYMTVFAYHVTRPAPTIPIADNIIPIFVGLERRSYNRNSQEHTLEQREIWRKWWEAIGRKNQMIWRPNMIYRSQGLPYIFTRRHGENMHFMAEHGLAGVTTNNIAGWWSTQGPQIYLIAKLLWNPKADVEAIMDDYYQRAFGPAAPYVKQYFQQYEELFAKLAEQYKGHAYHVYLDPPRLFREIRLDSEPATGRLGQEGIARHKVIENRAQELLTQAAESLAGADPVYRERLAFVQAGFDYLQAQLDCIEAMNDFRSKPTEENRKRAIEADERREQVLKANANTFAFDYMEILKLLESRPQDFGPPTGKKAPAKETKEEQEALKHELEA